MSKIENTKVNIENAQQYVDFVKDNLQPLAEHLKVGVDWLWSILVMQARVEAIVYLIIAVSMTITTAALIRTFFKYLKNTEWHKSSYDLIGGPTNKEGAVALVAGIGSVVMLIATGLTTSNTLYPIVTGLVNPEFRAIEKIVEFAKPKVDEAKTKVEVEAK